MNERSHSAESILRALQNEFETHAPHFRQLAADLVEAVVTDFSRAARLYRTVDWWGGSGSVADFVPDDVDARRRIMRLLVDLVQAMDGLGIPCPRASQWTDTFADWLERGIV